MKMLNINPNEVIIQENLEHTISNESNKFKYYLENQTEKKVIVYLYKKHFIVLDGNKLCTSYRILNKNITIIYLENKKDFEDFYQLHDAKLYDSRLINFDLVIKLCNELIDFEKTHEINQKDYFTGYLKNQKKLFLSLNLANFNSDISYKGMSLECKQYLGI